MVHQERKPFQKAIINLLLALLFVCLAAYASAKPLNSEDAQQLSENGALAPKSTQSLEDIASLSPSASHEKARRLLSRPKRLQRRAVRPRRDTTTRSAESQVIGNVTVPKYILEMYENLTKKDPSGILQQTTQANTIRSLQTVANEPSNCRLYNFSLTSINSSEYIVKAELHLHLHLDQHEKNRKEIYVVIEPVKSSGSEAQWAFKDDIQLDKNGPQKYTFDVAAVISQWNRAGEKYAEFNVFVYSNLQAYLDSKRNTLGCDQVHFVHSSDNSETEPLLVVHSFDREVEKIGYKFILDQLNRTEIERRRREAGGAPDASDHNRNRRNVIPFCNRVKLNITSEEIPKNRGETVLMPYHYDAGICGGNCGQTIPTANELKHNQLVHILKASSSFRERHAEYTIGRCCAPIKYAPLEVIVHPAPSSEKKSAYLRIIPNMRIVQCDCLEIVDFNVEKR